MGSRAVGWKVRNLPTASPSASLEMGVFLLQPSWAINHVPCVVSQMQGRRARQMENLPSVPAQSRSLLPPAFGRGCGREKATRQSQLGEQLLGAVALSPVAAQGLPGALRWLTLVEAASGGESSPEKVFILHISGEVQGAGPGFCRVIGRLGSREGNDFAKATQKTEGHTRALTPCSQLRPDGRQSPRGGQ